MHKENRLTGNLFEQILDSSCGICGSQVLILTRFVALIIGHSPGVTRGQRSMVLFQGDWKGRGRRNGHQDM